MASCQNLVTKPQFVNRPLPGSEITDCPEEPKPPGVFMDDAELLRWSAAAIYSGRECRETLRKAKEWIHNPPKEPKETK